MRVESELSGGLDGSWAMLVGWVPLSRHHYGFQCIGVLAWLGNFSPCLVSVLGLHRYKRRRSGRRK